MTHHVIYVPGIGDHKAYRQDTAIHLWRIWGVRGHYHPVGWAGSEGFEPKLQRLLAQIDGYSAVGDSVSLIGFSAGASAVLNAFSARKTALNAVVCISGKINNPGGAHNYFRRNPAFSEALALLQTNLPNFTRDDRRKMLTLYPISDNVVQHQDAVMSEVKQWRIIAFSHAMAIAVSLTVYALPLVLHLKHRHLKLAK